MKDDEVMHNIKLGQKFFELRIFINKAMNLPILYKYFKPLNKNRRCKEQNVRYS